MSFFDIFGVDKIVKRPIFKLINSGSSVVIDEYCHPSDATVKARLETIYGSNPKIADVYFRDMTADGANNVLKGNTSIVSVSGMGPFIANSTNLKSLFANCYNMEHIDVSDWDVSKCDNLQTVFSYCGKVSTIDGIGDMDVSNTTTLTAMFQGIGSSAATPFSIDISNWKIKNGATITGLFNQGTNIKSVGNLYNWNTSGATSFQQMFNHCEILESTGNLSRWNTNSVSTMAAMFQCCYNLLNIGSLSNWNTSNVTGTSYMFNQCNVLEDIGDISRWDTGNLTNTAAMFQACFNLRNIGDLKNWNTSKLTNTSYMFNQCSKLKKIDLSDWNVSRITNMTAMFQGCSAITSVGNLENWDTSALISATRIFLGCHRISDLDDYIDRWDFSNVINTDYCFYDTPMRNLKFPRNIRILGTGMYSCNEITLERIRNNACPQNLLHTKNVIIPDSVKVIKNEVFINQKNVESIHIHSGVTQLGEDSYTATFNDILPDALVSITVDSRNPYFKSENNMVFSKDGKMCYGAAAAAFYLNYSAMTIPEGVEIMVGGAIRAMGYENIDDDESNMSLYEAGIYDKPFQSSSNLMRKITFPSTLTYIGDRVLQYAFFVEDVTILATTPPSLQATSFYTYRPVNGKIHVPAASVNAYKTASIWSNYASIIEPIP